MTQQLIQELIRLPKTIVGKRPNAGYREERGSRHCDLDLRPCGQDEGTFAIFVRQHIRFVENFSLGLRYRGGDFPSGITLVRYNGAHGESSRNPDGHYAKPHIHRMTEQEIASGSTRPQERDRTVTHKYIRLADALLVFFKDVGVSNYRAYFPDILQPELSYGHQ